MDFSQFREAVRTYRWVILGSGLGVALIASLAGYALSTYQVTSKVLVRPVSPDPTVATQPQIGVITTTGLTILQALEVSYVALLRSREVAERIVQRLNQERTAEPTATTWTDAARAVARRVNRAIRMALHLQRPFADVNPSEKQIQEVTDSINGALIPKSSVLLITVEHRQPERALRLGQLAAETFVEFSQKFNAAEATVSRQFLEQRAREAREALVAAQARMDQFRREHGIFLSIDDEGKQRVTDLIGLEGLSRNLDTDLRQSRNKIRDTKRELAAHPKVIPTSATTDNNPMISQLRLQLLSLESRLPTLLVDFTPNHPQVVALNQQIGDLRKQLQAETQRILGTEISALNPVHQTLLTSLAVEEVNLQGLLARKASVDSILTRLRDELSSLSRNRNAWDLLAQDIKFHGARFDQLMQDLHVARLTEATKLAEIRMLEVGAPPQFANWKGLPLLAFPVAGLVFGLAGGGGLAMGLYYFGRSAKDPGTVRARLNIPLYGVVDAGLSAQARLHPAPDAAWNSFRYARIKLSGSSASGRPLRWLVLAALGPDEDPAGVAACLAAVYAETGTRTLLVDGRNGEGVHPLLRAERFVLPGLDILTDGDADLPSAGDPNRIEKLSTVLRSRRADYEVVLLVAPPFATSVDAVQLALSPETDALLLVVWHLRTSLDACQEVKARLEDVGVRHVGLLYAR